MEKLVLIREVAIKRYLIIECVKVKEGSMWLKLRTV